MEQLDAYQLVVNLPYGAQRRVEMARALAMEPGVGLAQLSAPLAQVVQPDELQARVVVQSAVAEPFGDQGEGDHGFSVQNMGVQDRICVNVDFPFNGQSPRVIFTSDRCCRNEESIS